ncbi:hypothetical protein IW262DRAFT_1459082 [Armillaria fumosa]|nr:hypothetical protein IW262DRAFT_1459082 [Armillaria fumosa]
MHFQQEQKIGVLGDQLFWAQDHQFNEGTMTVASITANLGTRSQEEIYQELMRSQSALVPTVTSHSHLPHAGPTVQEWLKSCQATFDGFGDEEEEYLAKNAVDFHIFETGDFAALSHVWLEMIWQQHVLYWPPKDRSDNGLVEHRKHVQHALRWLFKAMDPEIHAQQLADAATHGHKFFHPGPPEIQHLMIQPTITHVP